MSLLSSLRAKAQTAFAWALDKINANVAHAKAATPEVVHPIIDELAHVAKQGASDAISAADAAAGPIINVGAEAVKLALRTAVATYVAPIAGAGGAAVLTAAGVDGVNALTKALVQELHNEALYILAKLATGTPVDGKLPAASAPAGG